MSGGHPRKSRRLVAMAAAVILPAAFMFAVVADAPHAFIIPLSILTFSFFRRQPLAYNDRGIIYTLVSVASLAVLLDFIIPIDMDRFNYIADILNTNMLVPGLLYLAAFATLFESGPHMLGISAAISLLCSMFGCDIVNSTARNSRMIMTNGLLSHFELFYAVTAAIELIALFALLFAARKASLGGNIQCEHARKTRRATAMATLALLIVGGTMFVGYRQYYFHLVSLETRLLRIGLKPFLRGRGRDGASFFAKEVDLRRAISPAILQNSDKVVLRAEGSAPPGYLRARSYGIFERGRWLATADHDKQLRLDDRDDNEILVYSTFVRDDAGMADERIDFYPVAISRLGAMPLPGNTAKIDMIAEAAFENRDGAVNADKWETEGGYRAYVPKIDQDSVFQRPATPPYAAEYLRFPDNLTKTLDHHLSRAPVMAANQQKPTDRGLIESVKQYLLNNYSYSLDEPRNNGVNPVGEFLNKTKRGHCELFASAAGMMMRRLGIPCRYVTGLFCVEAHPSGQYFVARFGDAHAWMEAYLRDEKRWILVEATPPAGIPSHKHEWNWFDQWSGRLAHAMRKSFAQIKLGFFAQAVLGIGGAALTAAWDFIKNPLRGAGTIMLMITLTWRFWRRKWRQRETRLKLPPNTEALTRAFSRAAIHCGRRTGIRRNGRTINEWLDDMTKTASGETATEFTSIAKDYQRLRYRPSPPDNTELTNFKRRTENFTRQYARRRSLSFP